MEVVEEKGDLRRGKESWGGQLRVQGRL